MDGDKRNWRVIAQRARTGEILHRNVPLKQPSTMRELSGPGGVFGTLNPELKQQIADDGRPLLEPWNTKLYVEEDGQIRAGGLVTGPDADGPSLKVDAPGFIGYCTGIPMMDQYQPTEFEDPIQVFRNLLAYVQSFPNSNLGLTVDPAAASWMRLSDGQGPYNLVATDYRDVGQELDTIARTVPFDYAESHAWADERHTTIKSTLSIGFPRLGRLRDDLRFVSGENIINSVPIRWRGEEYANDVVVLGRGEGLARPTARVAYDDGRLRRVAVINEPNATQGTVDRLAGSQVKARELTYDVASLTVRDHPNARISSIAVGDDLPVTLRLEWVGLVNIRLRVLAIQESGDVPGAAVLKTQRSDTFTYPSATSPSGQPEVVIL